MTIETLKPTLLVLIIGLLGILAQSLLDGNELLSVASISVHFNQLVSACQEQHPSWESKVCERIVRGELWIGMTDEMVLASLGEPRSIEQPRSDNSEYEKWTYRTARYGEEILRIEDGIFTGLLPVEGCTTCGIQQERTVGR
ncbi:hypothetical protein KAT84_02065 [Candidatus Bipolaricaulota bacterium]|nr:hypothetical protein [Candidatus Bipolaricaulota bacterium]